MQPKAYTVGNPEAYEPYLDEEPDPRKAKGGIVFLAREEAEEVVKGGFLPSEWFDGLVLPGRVYGLVCDPLIDVEEGEHGLMLKRPVPVIRV
jgi:hypothetical protein